MHRWNPATLLVCVFALISARAAWAGPPPNYDFDWVAIAHVGNRATVPSEVPWDTTLQIGAVNHEYRITKTEVTVRQYFEFVQAYAPYWTGPPSSSQFTGGWIRYSTTSGYSYPAERAEWPIDVTWRMAARYVNWLNNGKNPEQWAFESGAYDASTFITHPDQSRSDQMVHDLGATFWIPTLDETVKASHYDPNRYGLGQEGYWLFPDGSDDPLIQGLPTEGGTTNEAMFAAGFLNVGSYPFAPSPMGILDASGGEVEWTESVVNALYRSRATRGSGVGSDIPGFYDRLDLSYLMEAPPEVLRGFRIASIVPSPGMAIVVVPMLHVLTGRPQREKQA